MSENIIEKAIMFATIAHAGQVRKSTPDIPEIVHPLAVAQILIEYGADNTVIAAGVLHDVAEDTKYSLEDIKNKFGEDIAHLVEVATEKDKSKTWEERRLQKIQFSRTLEIREKLVPLADKINNIESILRKNKECGYDDFTAFKRGKKYQEWYYRNMYKSLSYGQDENNPLVKRLEKGINDTFKRSMQEYDDSIDKIKIEQEIIKKIEEVER